MLKSFGNNLLIAAIAITPFLLSACGEDPNTPEKFQNSMVKVISTPAPSTRLDYQALLFRDK